MDHALVLLAAGLLIGFIGTLIGAGGGFLLVPLLLFTHRELTPEIVTAVSLAVVACNALSGSIAYARSGRVDFKAGILFALFTIPGSVLGVFLTEYIPTHIFSFVFGIILLLLAIFLFVRTKNQKTVTDTFSNQPHLTERTLTDKHNVTYHYAYNKYVGILISIMVGFISPLLGIGGGIIHVPAMVNWLSFPVHIATATSHFILAIMASISVIVHAVRGNYNDSHILHLVVWLCIGVIAGAQGGAYFSHRVKNTFIVKALAVCLGIVGIRLLMSIA
ncbi:MAG TPA: sulfite exporter TauE/SafE family protein [Bacteroidia bacterium]|nr:sulfite exporter TauE/SafE family protein [Bacteroidia bacterium]HNT83494.1 sulfite exporter TauE/SafE family protein [Bacteroidia bacterium]